MRATLIKTDGPWLEATIATTHGDLVVMDEFSMVDQTSPREGDHFDVELSTFIDDGASWEEMFSGNPNRLKRLDPIDGWSYRAYGKITSIDPVTVDCGLIQIQDVLYSNDSRIIGDFISFLITRLGATLIHTQTD